MKKSIVLAILLLMSNTASAQDSTSASKFGLGFNFSSGSPLLCFVSEHWRIEPGFGVSISYTDNSGSASNDHASRITPFVTLGLYYQNQLSKNFNLYYGPQVRGSASFTSDRYDTVTYHRSGFSPGLSAKVGVEYIIARHFSVSGEAAIGFTISGRVKSDYVYDVTSTWSYALSTSTGLIARYYF